MKIEELQRELFKWLLTQELPITANVVLPSILIELECGATRVSLTTCDYYRQEDTIQCERCATALSFQFIK